MKKQPLNKTKGQYGLIFKAIRSFDGKECAIKVSNRPFSTLDEKE
jgi:serine/threonine protein kinase